MSDKQPKLSMREIYFDLSDGKPRKSVREPTTEELMELISTSRLIRFFSGNSLIAELAKNWFHPHGGSSPLASFAIEYLTSRCVCFYGISENGIKVVRALTGEDENRSTEC
ncbi:hypothetical protein KJ885_05175 [Patescibacteria group bacterium]|nr:hypothetical protein [Patescibacteria group bacterium]